MTNENKKTYEDGPQMFCPLHGGLCNRDCVCLTWNSLPNGDCYWSCDNPMLQKGAMFDLVEAIHCAVNAIGLAR